MFISKPVTDIIKEMNDCTSLATLRYYYSFCKNIVNEINQSNILFHCEIGFDKTKVTIKSMNGTEFLYFIVDDLIEIVPADIQREILQTVLELCGETMECIEKRISVVEELDRKTTQEVVIYLVSGFFLTIAGNSMHNADVSGYITEFLGIAGSEIPVLTFALKCIGVILMTIACLIVLQLFVRRNFSTGIKI